MTKHKSEEPAPSRNDSFFTKQEAIDLAKDIISHSRTCLVGTIGEDGYPNIKAMTNRKHENIKTIWFATDTSSRRTEQLRNDNRACVYCLDTVDSRGLMLVGDIEILHDMESKRMLWIDGEEQYRPLGVDDPEYSVLRFTAKQADVVDAMKNKGLTFEID